MILELWAVLRSEVANTVAANVDGKLEAVGPCTFLKGRLEPKLKISRNWINQLVPTSLHHLILTMC